MTVMFRHNGAMHTMRPDGVYRTSVLQPMANYSPQADVMAIAQEFTQGPPLGTMLQGLGAQPSIMDRIRAFFSRGSQGQLVAAANQIVNHTPAPAQAMGSQVAPQQAGQMQMLMQLSRGSMLPGIATASRALQRRRFLTFYKAG